ncbi:MAG TPA: response regulator [Phycisphaerae bacterium]|nr:response regulator [Phycisphaerae bacterium]
MKKLVICDDEPHIVEGLRYLLRAPDRQILTARNGQEAVDLVASHTPDLLIIDIMMPVMNGLDAVAAVREREEFKDLPIIILTAKGQASIRDGSQHFLGATVMPKPFEPKQLRQFVAEILESKISITQ